MAQKEYIPTVDHLSSHLKRPTVTLYSPKGNPAIFNAEDGAAWRAKGWTDAPPQPGEQGLDAAHHVTPAPTGEDKGKFVERIVLAGQADIAKVSKADLILAASYIGAPTAGSKADVLDGMVKALAE